MQPFEPDENPVMLGEVNDTIFGPWLDILFYAERHQPPYLLKLGRERMGG
jgi:hypothetical protein